jgi:glycosyltransferase involved in cell wall biosynthesis
MRLAVFTSLFPGRINTFFARDMAALRAAGIDLDIFPLYPLDADSWRYVPEILNERVLPRSRVHHLSVWQAMRPRGLTRGSRVARFLRDSCAIRTSAVQYGLRPVMKSEYTFLKAWAWAQDHGDEYDHVLAYWGNYSASCAYLFHRLMTRPVPFSMFLHAGTDLYRDQVFLRQKLLYADNVFVVCDFNRRFIQERFADIYPRIEEKIRVYHLGLDLSEFAFQLEGHEARTILAVGSLEKIKGFDVLIEAAAQLVRRGQDIQLEIVGNGPEREHLGELSRRLGIESRIVFHGFQPFDRVRHAMTEATILVHPSPSLGDAVPTVIKEAMAVGTPVVATHVAGIPELLDQGRCGVLVPPKDVTALAAGIERLMCDADLRRQLALAGRRYIEDKFNLWQNGSQLALRLRCATRAGTPATYAAEAERVS